MSAKNQILEHLQNPQISLQWLFLLSTVLIQKHLESNNWVGLVIIL